MTTNVHAAEVVTGNKKSLQLFLAAVVFFSIAVPAIISGGVLIRENYRRTIAQDSVSAAHNYADLLEVGMGVALWNVSVDLGKPIMDSIMVDPSVLSIAVTTDNNEVFLEQHRESPALTAEDAMTVKRNISYNNIRLGQVEIVYSLAKAKTRVASETKLLAVIILIQLIVTLVTISSALHSRVLSPLKKLCAFAVGITKGDFKTTSPQLRDDEFGVLSNELETMRGSLEENFGELESRVDDRTAELRSMNHAMKLMLDQLQETQKNLIQSEKLAALGALVAGVAHELNTPIGNGLTVATTLCNSCNVMKKQMQNGLTKSALQKFVMDMDEGSQLVNRNLQRASELVVSFKQVAVDRTSAQRRKFSIDDLVNETCLTMSPMIKRTPHQVEIDIREDCFLDSFPGPLGQVITNLLNNALIHAFEGETAGKVLISTRNVDGGVLLTVVDNGVGIAAEHQAKIFDPFFTTKLGAGGNGLGMHIVHNIVTVVLGGSIKLQSGAGEGTGFTLFLPREAPVEDAFQDEEFSRRVALS